MLARVGRLSTQRRRVVLIGAVAVFAAAGAFGAGVVSELGTGGFADPRSESFRAAQTLEEVFETGVPNILLLVTAETGDVDDPAVAEAGRSLAAELAAEADVAGVTSYWELPPGNPLRSQGGEHALVLARIVGDEQTVDERIGDLGPGYTREGAVITVAVGGFEEIFRQVSTTIEEDLVRAELLAFPITLLLLLIVFRGAVAAALPIGIGALSVVSTFAVLRIVNSFVEVSIFALNLTTAMGLGLAIDYSLLVVSRYREELAAGHEPADAVTRTVRTAGRTVLFSALTTAAALSALLLFPFSFLRSFAYAGMAVASLAGLFAVVVLPAVLATLGRRVDALSLPRRQPKPVEEGGWHRLATLVMRRPWPFTIGALGVLLVLGLPFTGLRLGLPDDRVLPESNPARQVMDTIRTDFDSAEAGALSVVAAGVDASGHADDITAYATELSRVEGAARVDAYTGIFVGGDQVVGTNPVLTERFGAAGGTFLSVVPDVEPISEEGERLVEAVRATPAPFPVQVTGLSAELVDAKESLISVLPWAALLLAAITFVLLFLAFGSIVIPLKAIVLNVLSLSATFGAMVWIFQDGNLSGLLDFTATGSIAVTMPILMFCIAFGLSMDYEVFLLSRIKEEYDRSGDNEQSVAVGLERTGRIVTAAALIISVIFLAFATSGVSFIKLFGIGLALAVLMDAFLIRAALVPAFMRIAGRANWWAPAPLRRFHDRFGIGEHVELDAGVGAVRPAFDGQAPIADGQRPRRRERPLVAPGREKQ